jgi:hypothetical protein
MGTETIRLSDEDFHRQRLNLNVWDSFAMNEFGGRHTLKVFGNANIGNLFLTNLQVSDMLVPADSVAVIQNWYARHAGLHGIDDAQRAQWGRFTRTTIVSLVVGCMPLLQLPLAELLQRKEGQRDEAEVTEPGIAGFAPSLFDRHEIEIAKMSGREMRRWNEISGHEQATWMATAKYSRSLLRAPLLAVVPARQNCHLMISRLAPPPMLDVRVWLHLEGIQAVDARLHES